MEQHIGYLTLVVDLDSLTNCYTTFFVADLLADNLSCKSIITFHLKVEAAMSTDPGVRVSSALHPNSVKTLDGYDDERRTREFAVGAPPHRARALRDAESAGDMHFIMAGN
jgi:hypothetical protein